MVQETRVPREKPLTCANHLQTLSHKIASGTPQARQGYMFNHYCLLFHFHLFHPCPYMIKKKCFNSFAVKIHTHFSAASSASVHSGHILTCGLVELAPPALAAIEAALKLQKFCWRLLILNTTNILSIAFNPFGVKLLHKEKYSSSDTLNFEVNRLSVILSLLSQKKNFCPKV